MLCFVLALSDNKVATQRQWLLHANVRSTLTTPLGTRPHKYNTCSTAQSARSFLMTQPTHPHIVQYTDQLLEDMHMFTDIVLDLYVYIIITQQRIQVLE